MHIHSRINIHLHTNMCVSTAITRDIFRQASALHHVGSSLHSDMTCRFGGGIQTRAILDSGLFFVLGVYVYVCVYVTDSEQWLLKCHSLTLPLPPCMPLSQLSHSLTHSLTHYVTDSEQWLLKCHSLTLPLPPCMPLSQLSHSLTHSLTHYVTDSEQWLLKCQVPPLMAVLEAQPKLPPEGPRGTRTLKSS